MFLVHMFSGLTEVVQELLDFVCVSWFPVLVKLPNSRVLPNIKNPVFKSTVPAIAGLPKF